jgi:hypothetical protein
MRLFTARYKAVAPSTSGTPLWLQASKLWVPRARAPPKFFERERSPVLSINAPN